VLVTAGGCEVLTRHLVDVGLISKGA